MEDKANYNESHNMTSNVDSANCSLERTVQEDKSNDVESAELSEDHKRRLEIIKKIKDGLEVRDILLKKLEERNDDLTTIDAHINCINTVLNVNKPEPDIHKYLSPFYFVPNYHINNFPIFLKNSKYILAVFNLGIPTKYPIKGGKLEGVYYTVGYKSKRLYYKHANYTNMDDNCVIYYCRTFYEKGLLQFQIKSDCGLNLADSGEVVFREFQKLFNFKIEFNSIEEFFGLKDLEIIQLIREKFDLGLRK